MALGHDSKGPTMISASKRHLAAFTLVAAALGGGGIGAGIYAAVAGGNSRPASAVAQAATPVAKTSALSVSQIYANDAKSVVEITVTTSSSDQTLTLGGSSSQQAQRSGFVYDTNGHIVTNQHVIDGADSITVTLTDGSTYKATVVGSDSSTDVAVLKV